VLKSYHKSPWLTKLTKLGELIYGHHQKIYAFLIDGVETLLIAAAIFLIIYAFLFRPFNVSGQSMYPIFITVNM